VVKRILRQGEGWERPESGDEVAVHYVGTLTDGTKFDSSRDRGEPFTFKLGQGVWRGLRGVWRGVCVLQGAARRSSLYAGLHRRLPHALTCVAGAPKASIGVNLTRDTLKVSHPQAIARPLARAPVPPPQKNHANHAGRVIKGWDLGVAAMKRGELATLTCAPGYAYGAAGSPPTIPPNATLVFEVELLSWKSVKDVSGASRVCVRGGKGVLPGACMGCQRVCVGVCVCCQPWQHKRWCVCDGVPPPMCCRTCCDTYTHNQVTAA
jgi:FK506-binding protein 4/5